jgi:hypothetical protein
MLQHGLGVGIGDEEGDVIPLENISANVVLSSGEMDSPVLVSYAAQ